VHLGEALRNFVLQPLRTLREIVTTKGTKNPRDRYYYQLPRITQIAQIKTIWLALSICQPSFVHLGEALRNFVLQPLRTLREIVTTKSTKNPRDRYYYQLPRITQIATG
jgi:7,8-dihydro-6-hydroxymethylpterin-pyrophosphokinase